MDDLAMSGSMSVPPNLGPEKLGTMEKGLSEEQKQDFSSARDGLRWVNGWVYKLGSIVLLLQVAVLLARMFVESASGAAALQTSWLWEVCVAVGLSTFMAAEQLCRMGALGKFFQKSKTNLIDLAAVMAIVGVVAVRVAFAVQSAIDEVDLALLAVHSMICCGRLLSRPASQRYSQLLLSSMNAGPELQIAVDSVQQAIRSFPFCTLNEALVLHRDLEIVSGKTSGMISMPEYLEFLATALIHRPAKMTASEMIAHLQSMVVHDAQMAYGPLEVIQSTASHWSTQKRNVLLATLSSIILAAVAPAQAYALQGIVDGLKDGLTSSVHTNIIFLLVLCIPNILGNNALGYAQSAVISTGIKKLQMDLVQTTLSSPTEFFSLYTEGELNNIFNSDIQRVSTLWISIVWNLINPAATVIFSILYVFYRQWIAGFVGISFMLVILIVGPRVKAANLSKDYVTNNAYLAAEFQNGITCQKAIRAYGLQSYFINKFEKSSELLRQTTMKSQLWSNIVQIEVTSGMNLFIALLTAALALASADGDLSIGSFTAMVQLYNGMINPVANIGGFMRWAISNSGSLQKIDNLLARQSNVHTQGMKDSTRAVRMPSAPLTSGIRFEDVTFKYQPLQSKYTINHANFLVPAGTFVCVCGTSGGGKSTILNLLLRFREPNGGVIRVDDVPLNDYDYQSYLKQVGIVFQETMLLNGTILENIRYGNVTATDDDCIEAAKLAECDKFVSSLDEGFNTVLGQHAKVSISGGQAQRICLARALCRKPSILLLDEATSALDPETESEILSSVRKLCKERKITLISVTHRLHTTAEADKILVFKDGMLVEEGTFSDLRDAKGTFWDLLSRDSSSSRRTETDLSRNDVDRLVTDVKQRLSTSTRSLLRMMSSHSKLE